MSAEHLPIAVANAVDENIDLLAGVVNRSAERDEVLAFCRNFRIAGIGLLLVSGSADPFRRMLHMSGRAFAHYLDKADPSAKRTSQSDPFFDAVAAGDMATAEEIAVRSSRSWVAEEEYEEDFLFPEYLMQRFFLGAAKPAREDLLVRWEAALQGSEDGRCDVCKALEHGDGPALGPALERLLRERKDRFDRLAEREAIAPEVYDTEGQVAIEGLALVRLAESLGLPTEREYPNVPSLARGGPAQAWVADDWTRIDR
jgi:hypothetical protein